MKLKDFRLDVEALFSQVVYGHGYMHYGYWEEGNPPVASLEGLGQAQSAYFEQIVETIPRDVSSILDVGSGTGSNAAGLTEKGFSVDCVCPSANLNKVAETKLSESSRIFETRFEDFSTDKTYDMLLFSESFHYLYADVALKKALEMSEKYVLILDYYRKKDSVNTQRISYRQFTYLIEETLKGQYEVASDRDITQQIIPTFYVLDELSNQYLKPFLTTAVSRYKKDHPIYGFMFGLFLNKLARFSGKKSHRYEKFMNDNEYRITLLSKV